MECITLEQYKEVLDKGNETWYSIPKHKNRIRITQYNKTLIESVIECEKQNLDVVGKIVKILYVTTGNHGTNTYPECFKRFNEIERPISRESEKSLLWDDYYGTKGYIPKRKILACIIL